MTASGQPDDPGDSLTVLTSRQGKLATKRIVASWSGPPTIEDYPRGSTWFSFDDLPIGKFDAMAAALTMLQNRAYSFVVRGRIIDGTNRRHALRRARARKDQPATLEAAARHWIAIDFDSIPCPAHLDPAHDVDAVVEHVAALLPEDFHGVSCFWSFTSGQGFKPGLRLRLWYWANRPVDDRELKTWLGDSPIDLSLFAPAQPHYTSRPIFAGVVDPVPYRCGVWRGYTDTVAVPPIEKPQARTFTNGTDGPFTNLAGGAGYEFHCGQIGDHDGGAGFFRPIKSAVAAWIAQHGAAADTAWLREDLERIIRAAPRDPTKHPDDHYIEVRVADLDPLITAIGEMEAAKEAEPVEPTYTPPEGDTLDQARAKLALEMQRFTKAALAHIERTTTLKAEAEERGVLETYEAPAPPVHGVNAAVGLGKTRAWREEVAAAFVEQDQHPVLAVPRHRLGDEIVGDFTKAGIIARDFRGREYPDPEQPGKAMCHDLERIKAIEEAGGDISRQACHSKSAQCAFYDSCGYQQQRRERPDAWLMPHQLLTRPKPKFIACDTLGIDESFWSVPLHGIEHRVTLELSALIIGDRSVPQGYRSDGPFDAAGTADLVAISRAVHDLIMAEPDGRLRRAALTAALYSAGVSLDDLRAAYRLEWARKIKLLDVTPGMPPATVKELCGRVAAHNRQVGKLGRFWKLLADTVAGGTFRSPWIDLNHEAKTHKDVVEPAVYMAWCDEIHETWRSGPTMVMDATMPVGIVQRFYPGMAEPAQITAPAPFVRVRQITDAPMSKNRLIPTSDQDTPQNRTRLANVERVRRFIEVRACEAGNDKVAVICNEGLETLLKAGALPGNVEIDHYNNVTGENRFADAAVLILIGRPEAPPLAAELVARVLFETDIEAIAADAGGRVNYPLVRRGIRRRDGSAAAVNGPRHPDPHVEEVRQAICESELIQAAGRGRGINRTAANPLQIDILTNVVLPLAVDETTTWEAIQPRLVEVMRARSAVPFGYADAAACYPDLFTSAEAARKALKRENPGQIAIELFYIAVCPGFLSVGYRRRGSRGPPGRLLYDPAKIDPQAWLQEKLGDAAVLPACQWFVVDEGRLRRCGAEVAPGMTWCAAHVEHAAAIAGQDDHQVPEQAAAN